MAKKHKKGFYEKYIKVPQDVFLAAVALIVLSPVLLVVAILVRVKLGSPVIFKQERAGKNGKPYYMYKFRSMKVNAPNLLNPDGSTFNSATDSRVTKVGKIIRETSIDEIPQILNILKGEMSIIGPRASGYEALENYKEDEMDKMNVVPGITGYTQAYFRNGLSVRDKRLKDAWYAQNVSFALDVKIFFKSILTVLKHENIYTNEAEEILPIADEKETVEK